MGDPDVPLSGLGSVLSPEDSVALRVAALHERGLPRDFADVYAATQHFSNGELLALGRRMLDGELFLADLRDQLDHVAVFGDEQFAEHGVDPGQIVAIRRWAQQWSDEIGQDLAEEEPWNDEVPDDTDEEDVGADDAEKGPEGLT
jgi:hypothetical protein